MAQPNLDDFSHLLIQPKPPSAPSTRTVAFLDLPYSVRHRIYVLVGLVRTCPINLNQEGPRARHYRDEDIESIDFEFKCFFEARKFMGKWYPEYCRPACYCTPLPLSLLYISRAVSEEVSRILYSENSFTIGRSDSLGECGLEPLRNLSTSALSCLRVLTIRLNSCECIYEGPFERSRDKQGYERYSTLSRYIHKSQPEGLFSCHPLCQQYRVHDEPLHGPARQHAESLQDWQDAICMIAANCRLENLRLDLICDTEDMEMAYEIVNRLSPIQNLRACSIRLSKSRSWQHSALARNTAYRLVGHAPEQGPDAKPKTYHVPTEILTQILEYSELLAPFDLEWNPDRGLVPFDCCKECTATLDSCACSSYHGAYSRTCTCWSLPLSIFLVSRQVHDIARTIFFQQNRFIVLEAGCRLADLGSCRSYPGLAAFFQRLPPNTAPLLRALGLVFLLPYYEDDPIGAQHAAEWAEIPGLLTAACDVAKLDVALFIGVQKEIWGAFRPPHNYRIRTGTMPNLPNKILMYAQVPGSRTYFSSLSSGYHRRARYSTVLESEVHRSGYRGRWARLPRLWYDGITFSSELSEHRVVEAYTYVK